MFFSLDYQPFLTNYTPTKLAIIKLIFECTFHINQVIDISSLLTGSSLHPSRSGLVGSQCIINHCKSYCK